LEEHHSSVFTRLLYARLEENEDQADKAIEILRGGLATGGNDSRLRDRLALLLIQHHPEQHEEILGHLRAAVVIPTNDYLPRYHLAYYLFQQGQYPESYTHFESLSELNLPSAERFSTLWSRYDNSRSQRYYGQVATLRYDYGFIRSEFPTDIYFRRLDVDTTHRTQLRVGSRVSFSLSFNLRGPVARNVMSIAG
jgi:cold shock CspA family protein